MLSKELQEFKFFRHCSLYHPKYPVWPFGHLLYGDAKQLLCSFLGGYHAQKRFSLQFASGIKKIVFGNLWTDLSAALNAGLPIHAYALREPQSDKASAARMSPSNWGRGWSSLGGHIFCLLGALIAAVTTASHAFTVKQRASNAFSLHYLLLLHTAHNRKVYGRAWEKYSIAFTTVKNMCLVAACAVTSCRTREEPKGMMELRIEHHFSAIKKHCRGSATIKDGIIGEAREHARQARELRALTSEDIPVCWTDHPRCPLKEEELAEIASEALANSLQMYSFISVDLTEEQAVFHCIL